MQRNTATKWLKIITYIGIYGGLLMPVFFWPNVIFPFVFSKLSYLQFLIGLTFPAYIVLAWIEPAYRPRRSMLYLAIIAYFAAIAVSTIFSVDPIRSWWGNQERMNGLFTLLHFFAWLTMTIGTLKTWTSWRRLLNYEVGLSAFMAIVALLQKPFPRLLVFQAGARVGGLLDNPIYMAAYQIFNLFFIALLWMKGPASRTAKIIYILIALVDFGAFIAAESRGALVGLAAGMIVFAIAYGIMTPNRKARRIVLASVFLIFATYGVIFAARETNFIKQSPVARFTDFSGASRTRFIAWNIAWKGFLERPLTGWGFDAFHILFNEKYNPQSLRYGYYETWFDRSHNTVMDVLAMTGIFGAVTFAAVWIVLLTSVVQTHRKKWSDVATTSVLLALPVAYFVQNLFVFDHPAAFSMSFLLYGLVIAMSSPAFNAPSGTEVAKVSSSGSITIPWIAFGVLQIAGILLVWHATVLPYKASYYSIKSNTAFANGQFQVAYDLAVKAAAIPTPYMDEQTFLQARNYITLVGNNQASALSYWRAWHDLIAQLNDRFFKAHPKDVHSHFIYGRFADTMSAMVPEDVPIAEQEYRKAINLSPMRQQMFFSLSRFLIAHGRTDEGVSLLRQAVSFDDAVGESHWQLGLALFFDKKDYLNGAQELAQAMKGEAHYTLQDAREAEALSYAYDILSDKDGLKSLIQLLPTLPQAPMTTYLAIAQAMERQGLIDERNMILNAVARLDQQTGLRLVPLMNGSVTSIQAALNMTKDMTGGLVTTNATSTEPTSVATSSGPGPRR